MCLEELVRRREKSTVLVTLSVSCDSSLDSVIEQLKKEYATAFNIKDKWTRKRIQKTLSRILNRLSKVRLPKSGFIMFGAYDGVWTVIPDRVVTRDFYVCGKKFETEYLRQLMEPQERIGKIWISSKKAVISIVEGECEESKFKLTSGIPGKHGKGGQSRDRFARKREEQVNAFLRRVQSYANTMKAERWIFEGDRALVKRFEKINRRR